MNRVDRRQFIKAACATGGSVGLVACLADGQNRRGTDHRTRLNGTTRTDDSSADTPNESLPDGDESDDEPENGGDPTDHDSTGLSENGAVVFVYHEGPMEDYTQAFPVHQEFDAPATTGIVSEWIGREDFLDNDWMDVDHLETLVDAGWEIASHTTVHTSLGTFDLVEPAEPTSTRIYPSNPQHGYYTGKDLEVTDGDRTVRRTVVDFGEDDVGQYIEFDDELGTSFAAGEAVERYPDDLMHEFLGDSKRDLERLGFDVESLLAPYDQFDERALEITVEYYDAVANADHGSRINDPETYDPHETRRDYFIEFTSPETVEADLDTVAEQGALGVLGAHTFKDEVDEAGIRQTFEWIEERDIEVLTLRDAVERTAQ